MTKYGHTKLPWRVTAVGEKKGPREVVGNEDQTIAKLTALDMENADFIVKACNAHYDLVAALQAAEDLYKAGLLGASYEQLQQTKALRRAALAKVKG